MQRSVLFALLLLLTGCASATDRRPFDDVRALVRDRTGGRRVQWNTGTSADRAADEAVNQLLSREISSDDAIQVALLDNRRLQASFEEIGIAQADLVAAGLLKNPILDGAVRFSTAGGGTGVELTVLQDFLEVLWIPLRQRVARAELEATKLRVANRVISLARDVRDAHVNHQAALQLRELRRAVVQATSAAYDLARRLRDAGNITELDLANQQALLEESKLDLNESELNAAATRERLNALLGLTGTAAEQWRVSDHLPPVVEEQAPAESLENLAVERSLALAEQRQRVRARGEQLGLTNRSALAQDVQVGANAERESEGGWGVGPAFSIPIPLFDQGQAKSAAARAALRRDRQNLRATEVEVRSEARAAVARLRLSRDRARHIEQVVLPLRRRAVEESQKQFNAMSIGVFQLLAAKQQEIDAGVRAVEALREYWLAKSRLDSILAGGQAIGSDGGNRDE
jgi:cobalt-zinc-cadmium efflux system outer membrane protein